MDVGSLHTYLGAYVFICVLAKMKPNPFRIKPPEVIKIMIIDVVTTIGKMFNLKKKNNNNKI